MRKLIINTAWALDFSQIDGRRYRWGRILTWVTERYGETPLVLR
jgi:hypothetical protein